MIAREMSSKFTKEPPRGHLLKKMFVAERLSTSYRQEID